MDQQTWREDRGTSALDRKDILAMQVLAPLSPSYLPWSVSAMRPSGVVAVLNEIVLNQRRRIVELGSGISTIYIGCLLSRRGGQLRTVEHDGRWADVIEEELKREELTDVVTVVRAPLKPIRSAPANEGAHWYKRDTLRKAVDGPVDLLVADGPPAYQEGHEHARFPAVPFFAPLLAEDYASTGDPG
jgi:tRNA A58 N-methylase Trm61